MARFEHFFRNGEEEFVATLNREEVEVLRDFFTYTGNGETVSQQVVSSARIEHDACYGLGTGALGILDRANKSAERRAALESERVRLVEELNRVESELYQG